MTLTARDKKIVMVIVPLVLLFAYWFLALAPQRATVAKLDEQLMTLESDRDAAQTKATGLQASKDTYADDYATVVRLGKAVPQSLDMPSLLVQLDSAADGTGIDFDSITAGERASAGGSAATPAAGSAGSTASGSGSGTSTPPVAAGGATAQSGAGQATEKANNASKTSDGANQAAGASTAGSAATSGAAASQSAPGLDSVPLTFTFKGSYFHLADFLHRVKRFVRVAGSDIKVRGRLMTIDGVTFDSESFPVVKAQINATVYLSPKSEGTTAGGTAAGPTTTSTSGSATTGSGGSSSTSSTLPPAGGAQ